MGACEECEHCKRKDCQWDYMYADEETAIDCMDFWRIGEKFETLSDVIIARQKWKERSDTPRGSVEYGTQETKRIKKIIWEVLHGGYSIDTPVDQDWLSTKIFLLIDGYDEEEADNVADETCK